MAKVLYLTHTLGNGGAQSLIRDYCLFMDKKRACLVVLAARREGHPIERVLEQAGIRVYYCSDHYHKLPLPSPLMRIFHVFERLFLCRSFIRSENPDILHTHLQVNIFAAFAAPKRSVRMFHTVHNEPKKQWNSGGLSPLIDYWAVRYLRCRYGLRFISLHEKMRNELSRMFSGDPGYVLPNGISIPENMGTKFENQKSDSGVLRMLKQKLRKKKGLPEKAFIVGHVGRFTEQKNHFFLLQIFEEIIKRKPDAFLLMIGDGKLKADIEKKLSGNYNKESYLILSDRDDVVELMQCMDVFLLPSLWEGLPISLIEAQSVGLPCLVSERIQRLSLDSMRLRVMRLSRGADAWARGAILEAKDRRNVKGLENYRIENVIERLMEIYGI